LHTEILSALSSNFFQQFLTALSDALGCGSSLPAVNSIKFDDEELDREPIVRVNRIRIVESPPINRKQSSSLEGLDDKMGGKCVRAIRRGYSFSDGEAEVEESR
jgi:hypothetical protein